MLTSLAIIFLLGLSLGELSKKLKLPSLVGMLIAGIIIGPNALNLLDSSMVSISSDLRKLALVIILTRAGLALDMEDLKRVGRPAILMSFVPACLEITGIVLIAPSLLDITILEAAIMGTVIAAVSPAVIVPRMLKLMEEGYGKDKSIPQLIMASASVDDVFVIVLFTAFTTLATGGEISINSFIGIPISIVVGLIVGIVVGVCLVQFFKLIHIRDSVKILILLSVSFLLIALESILDGMLPFSSLLAIMSIGGTVLKKNEVLAKRLSIRFSKLWIAAEILLFVLVGASVDVNYALSAGVPVIVLVISALIFRMIGVFICLIKTNLVFKERLFCMIAYLPKATVQAAIGALPLSMGLDCGQIVLTAAVIAILLTAPIGAFGLDLTYKKFLKLGTVNKKKI